MPPPLAPVPYKKPFFLATLNASEIEEDMTTIITNTKRSGRRPAASPGPPLPAMTHAPNFYAQQQQNAAQQQAAHPPPLLPRPVVAASGTNGHAAAAAGGAGQQ